jgi:uncharacterized protein
MTQQNSRMIFVNMAVRDLKKSMEFFTKLGFTYNLKFTDDKAACMIVNEQACAMLLATPYFKTFTKKEVCDTSTHSEALIALSCSSRAEVDELVAKAVAGGGTHAMPAIDHGFMYGWSFYDLDGHHWEVLWMDPKAAMG